MKVLFDYQAFEMQDHGGVSRCFSELYSHFPSNVYVKLGVRQTKNTYLLHQGFEPTDYTYNKLKSYFPFPKKGIIFSLYQKAIGKYSYLTRDNHLYCKKLLTSGNYDVFHPTYFKDWYLPFLGNTPFVLTIHDMIPELYPQFFKNDDIQIVMKRKLAPLANKIIAVSENTKKDIIDILGVEESKIEVVYHGVNKWDFSFQKRSPFPFSYILYVGDRFGYKNFPLFIESLSIFIKKHKDISLVCTGKPFNQTELALIHHFGIHSNVHQSFVKTDEELFNLYHHAMCFVYPSEYEGFGIPILEAYEADCPVMLNNKSCFPEIAGDAAIYFNLSTTHNDLYEVLEDFYLNYDKNRSCLLKKQRERLKNYSWEKSAIKLADIYHTII